MSNEETKSTGGTPSRRTLWGLVAAVATIALIGVLVKWQHDASARRQLQDKSANVAPSGGKE
jgi:hypothetical protein